MSRPIDADALIHELNNSHYPGAPYVDAGISIAIGKVCDAPTIEPERKKGKWIQESYYTNKWGDRIEKNRCSICGFKHDYCRGNTSLDDSGRFDYCPHCGAYMGGEQE